MGSVYRWFYLTFIIFLHSSQVHQCSSLFLSSADVLLTKQPPHLALITYFAVTSLSGTHQDALAFTLQ